MQQQEMQTRIQEKQMQLDHEMQEAEKDRRKDILIAEIKSAGYGSMADINQNQQNDYMDALGEIQKSDQFQETMNLQNTKETNRTQNDREKAIFFCNSAAFAVLLFSNNSSKSLRV